MDQEQDFQSSWLSEFNVKVQDLEEKHRLSKERILLIGQNLIEMREETETDLSELKKDMEILKGEIKRLKEIIQSVSDELDKTARKEELLILERQFKMFEPLTLIKARTKQEEKIEEKRDEPEIKEYVKKFWNGRV